MSELMKNRIETKLTAGLKPFELFVVNESHMHRGPKDAETHFKVVIVSQTFQGLRAVARHQKLYELLKSELNEGVHALSIQAMTPDEWAKDDKIRNSPECQHKSVK